MEPLRIYGKTEHGVAALSAARGALSSSARQLLILVNGQRSVGELQEIFGAEALSTSLPQLEAQGYVQYLRDSTPASPAILPVAAARHPPAATPSARPSGPPRNRLAISLLALGVLSASAAIWWFLGPTRGPGSIFSADVSTSPPAEVPATVNPESAAATAMPVSPAPVGSLVDKGAPRGRDLARADTRTEPRIVAPKPTAPQSVAVTPNPATTAKPVAPENGASGPRSDAAAVTPTPTPAPAPARSAPAPVATPTTQAAPAAPALVPSPAPTGAPPPSTTSTTISPPSTPANAPATPASVPVLHPREKPLPVLSRRARRAGVDSGQLRVRFHVTAGGAVGSIEVLKANPPTVYDTDVQQTLQKWTFDPPGVPGVYTVEFDFNP